MTTFYVLGGIVLGAALISIAAFLYESLSKRLSDLERKGRNGNHIPGDSN